MQHPTVIRLFSAAHYDAMIRVDDAAGNVIETHEHRASSKSYNNTFSPQAVRPSVLCLSARVRRRFFRSAATNPR